MSAPDAALVAKVCAILPKLFLPEGSTKLAEEIVAVCMVDHAAAVEAAVQAERAACLRAVKNEALATQESDCDEAYNDAITDASNAIVQRTIAGKQDADFYGSRSPTDALAAALAAALAKAREDGMRAARDIIAHEAKMAQAHGLIDAPRVIDLIDAAVVTSAPQDAS